MKQYEKPTLKLVEMTEDVITTSCSCEIVEAVCCNCNREGETGDCGWDCIRVSWN